MITNCEIYEMLFWHSYISGGRRKVISNAEAAKIGKRIRDSQKPFSAKVIKKFAREFVKERRKKWKTEEKTAELKSEVKFGHDDTPSDAWCSNFLKLLANSIEDEEPEQVNIYIFFVPFSCLFIELKILADIFL